MEKFSAFRDPGTGIQPFLKPVPPPNSGPELLAKALLPIRLVIGILRTSLIAVFLCLYLTLVSGVGTVLSVLPPLGRLYCYALTSVISRAVLLLLGFAWIPVEIVTRKRGRNASTSDTWEPQAGDIIISNSVSWIEILWLAFRFDPIFLFPAVNEAPATAAVSSSPITNRTTGRKTGTGSANVTASNRAPTTRVPIVGYHQVSLLSAIHLTGLVPPLSQLGNSQPRALDDMRKKADRPLVIFPECTTSNGRALLRFAECFPGQAVPVKGWKAFIMCVRYDPPTPFAPTLSHSIPSTAFNPVLHLFELASSLSLPSISIRLLSPSESPSSPLFLASEFLNATAYDSANSTSSRDQLTECSAALIAQIGKMKRTGMGWEDKSALLELYQRNKKA